MSVSGLAHYSATNAPICLLQSKRGRERPWERVVVEAARTKLAKASNTSSDASVDRADVRVRVREVDSGRVYKASIERLYQVPPPKSCAMREPLEVNLWREELRMPPSVHRFALGKVCCLEAHSCPLFYAKTSLMQIRPGGAKGWCARRWTLCAVELCRMVLGDDGKRSEYWMRFRYEGDELFVSVFFAEKRFLLFLTLQATDVLRCVDGSEPMKMDARHVAVQSMITVITQQSDGDILPTRTYQFYDRR